MEVTISTQTLGTVVPETAERTEHLRPLQREEAKDRVKRDQLKKRVQLDFSPEAFERLKELREVPGAEGTNAGAIRLGLALLDWYVKCRAEGFTLAMQAPNGQVVPTPDLTKSY